MKRRLVHLVALSVVAVAALAGCGSDDGSGDVADESPATSAPTHATDLPFCSDIWVADAQLPSDYQGCEEDGQAVKPDRQSCSSGQKIVTYDDRFYAVMGGPVQETDGLASDPDFKRTMRVCQG
jgi:hypothetical protein